LKPDVVFFGEPIPEEALNTSFRLAASAEAVLVIGTSAVVSPANTIPTIAKSRGAKLIEMNMERTCLTDTVTDIFIEGKAGDTIPTLVGELRRLKGMAG
jgi:NAD-dependent deacetylase